jgi:hypothetical protein
MRPVIYRADDDDDDKQQKLEQHLEETIDIADSFAANAIRDDGVRREYERMVREGVDEIRSAYRRGHLSLDEAAHKAVDMRNAALGASRRDSSGIAKAIAAFMKSHGPTFQEELENKSRRLFNRAARHLTEAELEEVYYEIINSAQRTNPKVSRWARGASGVGAGFLVLSVLMAIMHLDHAEDKEQFRAEAAEMAAGILGGFGGGELAALGASAFWSTSPLFVAACILVGGFTGAEEAHRFARKHFGHLRRRP